MGELERVADGRNAMEFVDNPVFVEQVQVSGTFTSKPEDLRRPISLHRFHVHQRRQARLQQQSHMSSSFTKLAERLQHVVWTHNRRRFHAIKNPENAVGTPSNRRCLAHAGHALLCGLNWNRCGLNSRSLLPLRQCKPVVVSTTLSFAGFLATVDRSSSVALSLYFTQKKTSGILPSP